MSPNEQLALDKLEQEVEKLKLEVSSMRAPIRTYLRNPASYLTVATAMIGVLAFLGQSYVSEAKAERSKAELTKVELVKDKLEEETRQLGLRKAELDADSTRVWQEYSQIVSRRDAAQREMETLTENLKKAKTELASCGQSVAPLNAALNQAVKLEVKPQPTLLEARIYIQVADASERADARRLAQELRAPGVLVPEIETVGSKAAGLSQTEVRYFWDFDEAEAKALARKITETNRYGVVAVKLPASLKGKSRPRHFEVWIKSA